MSLPGKTVIALGYADGALLATEFILCVQSEKGLSENPNSVDSPSLGPYHISKANQ